MTQTDETARLETLADEANAAIKRYVDAGGKVADLALAESSMWLNAFRCIRPTDGFLLDVGRDLVQHCARVPGHVLVKVSIT